MFECFTVKVIMKLSSINIREKINRNRNWISCSRSSGFWNNILLKTGFYFSYSQDSYKVTDKLSVHAQFICLRSTPFSSVGIKFSY